MNPHPATCSLKERGTRDGDGEGGRTWRRLLETGGWGIAAIGRRGTLLAGGSTDRVASVRGHVLRATAQKAIQGVMYTAKASQKICLPVELGGA